MAAGSATDTGFGSGTGFLTHCWRNWTLINSRRLDYTKSMPLTEAHFGPLLIARAVIAVLLGLAANLLAARLLLDSGKAANDPAWQQRTVAYRTRRPATRGGPTRLTARTARTGLRLVARSGRQRAPDYVPVCFPKSAYHPPRKPLLQRAS